MPPWLTALISIAALFVSTLLLIVHYRNQLERRHGEVAQLISNLLARATTVQNRLTDMTIQIDTIKLSLRRMPDSDSKFDQLETMTHIQSEYKELLNKIRSLVGKIETIDPSKNNKNKSLYTLQSTSIDMIPIEEGARKIESIFQRALSAMANSTEE